MEQDCNELQEIDFNIKLMDLDDFDTSGEDKKQEKIQCTRCADEVNARCLKRKTDHIYRRAFSESKLLDILEHDFTTGTTYHCLSGGNIDSLSYLKHIIRQQNLHYVLFSTWCIADDDVLQFREWIESGKISRLDAYCGEIFPGSYAKQYRELKKVVSLCSGRVAIFRNHAKIFAGIGDKFAFAIESSANINTNPRTENTTITTGDDVFHFYKDFYDGIKSFTRDFDNWKKWEK